MRIEKDSLGEKKIPENAYYGIQTLRAIENFPISGMRLPLEMVKAIALIKMAAAQTNMELGALPSKKGMAIIKAAREVINGKFNSEFRVDVFQAGAGTSFNMNANEVLANRAIEYLKGKKGDYSIIHPNDHVNMAQSTNDIFPTTMRIASLFKLPQLLNSLDNLKKSLNSKSREFMGIIKSGRTHLQDAVPIRLGQEFKAWASMIAKSTERIKMAGEAIKELNIGGTAVGTGLNTLPGYQKKVVKRLSQLTDIDLRPAPDLIEITQNLNDFVHLSSALKLLAIDLIKIANDLRLLSSGPNTGLAEIVLPPVQPGSSIMPGKVNPVMLEAIDMVAFQIIGNDLTITLASQAGQLELNVMMPVVAHNGLQSIDILTNGCKVLDEKCIDGITADEARCREFADKSISIITALNPYIGYAKAAEIAKEAVRTKRSIKEVAFEKSNLKKDRIEKILDPFKMV